MGRLGSKEANQAGFFFFTTERGLRLLVKCFIMIQGLQIIITFPCKDRYPTNSILICEYEQIWVSHRSLINIILFAALFNTIVPKPVKTDV